MCQIKGAMMKKATTSKAMLMVTVVTVFFLTLAAACSVPLLVAYDGNGNTGGTAPTDINIYEMGSAVTVAGVGTLVCTRHTFDGWNTAADGSGTSYAAGSTLTMGPDDMTLYAQWTLWPLSELIIGTWAGVVAYPGVGDVYLESIYNAGGTCSHLVHENAGDPILEDMSLRGTYVVDGDQMTVSWGEMWSAGAWDPFEPPITSVTTIDPVDLAGETWTFDVDFDQDGVVDAVWTLTRQ